MNRRGFLTGILKAATAAAILPAATTYTRKWWAKKELTFEDLQHAQLVLSQDLARPNPNWVEARYTVWFAYSEDSFRTINIGPPPKGPIISKSIFWNGQ